MSPGRTEPSDLRLPAEKLHWECPEDWLPFETTEEVVPRTGIEGQAEAMEALRYGLEARGIGQNVFLAGLYGGGRMQLLCELTTRMRSGPGPQWEYAYVCNFTSPERPRLLPLPAGSGRKFKRLVRRLACYVRDDLGQALKSDAIRLRQEALDRREKQELDRVTEPFKAALAEADLELVSVRREGASAPAPELFPLVDGKPVAPEELEQLRDRGDVSAERFEQYLAAVERYEGQLAEITTRVGQIVQRSAERKREILESPARALLVQAAEPIVRDFPSAEVRAFVDGIVEDVVENRFEGTTLKPFDPTTVYGVNLLEPREVGGPRPVIVENHPSVLNLLGGIDAITQHADPNGYDEHLSIRAGSLLKADGGFLIVDARQLRGEDGAWKLLVRTLSSGVLDPSPPWIQRGNTRGLIRPDPIPIDVRVILVGDLGLYRELEKKEPDFREHFKISVLVESTIPRDADSAQRYAGVVARLTARAHLLPFARGGVAALIETGARLSDRPFELSTRFDQVEDVAGEAAYLAGRRHAAAVERIDVEEAVNRHFRRSDPPARRYRYLLRCGRFRVETSGEVVGQVNGIALMRATQLPYGIPARLTASIGPGTDGVMDIESEAELGGSIHTKGFQILNGVLRHLFARDHPLLLSASVAFEQSYGKIDGDSASAAETCCLISALAGVPMRQGMAMTGSIDQRGNIQAVGGCNEKIEGFFDACAETGLTGDQGVILPESNIGDLMLRPDIAAACARGEFHIYAVDRIEQALELFSGLPAGERGADGTYPEGTVLARAAARTRELWRLSTRKAEEDVGAAR